MQIKITVTDDSIDMLMDGAVSQDQLEGGMMAIIESLNNNAHDFFVQKTERDKDIPPEMHEAMTRLSQATTMLIMSKYCRSLAHGALKGMEDLIDIAEDEAAAEYKRMMLVTWDREVQ